MSLARSQSNYDNAQPADNSIREDAIERRKKQLSADMWQDLEYLTDAVSDAVGKIGWYRRKNFRVHPKAVTFLMLLGNGSDDIEAMRMLREASKAYIDQIAEDQAEEEAS